MARKSATVEVTMRFTVYQDRHGDVGSVWPEHDMKWMEEEAARIAMDNDDWEDETDD